MSAPSQSPTEFLLGWADTFERCGYDDTAGNIRKSAALLSEHDRLTEEVAKLREALTPFAEIADWYEGHVIGDGRVLMSAVGRTTVKITLGQCRAARAALPKEEVRS